MARIRVVGQTTRRINVVGGRAMGLSPAFLAESLGATLLPELSESAQYQHAPEQAQKPVSEDVVFDPKAVQAVPEPAEGHSRATAQGELAHGAVRDFEY